MWGSGDHETAGPGGTGLLTDGRLRAVLAATPDAVVTFDGQGVIDSANPAAERLFGYPAGQLVGHPVRLLLPAQDGASESWTGGAWEAEAVRRDGSRFAVEVSVGMADGAFAAVVRPVGPERSLVDAADAVRQRICEDLHDNVGQQLTGLGLMADTLAVRVAGAGAATEALVAQVAQKLRKVHADVRTLVSGTIPTDVPADGVVPALERLAAYVRDHCGCGCELTAAGPVRLADATAATQLFRIAQEAVCNAVRHAHPTTIRIVVRAEPGAVTAEVQDDGGGFSGGPGDAGLGTRLMRDRAARVGGTVSIASGGGGTVVTARVPAP
jgi:two-component system CheB/CheR fusion protein